MKKSLNFKKYHNNKVEFAGIKFDSKKERDCYILLKSKEDNGDISDLKLQVHFELLPAIYEEQVEHLKTKDRIKKVCVQRKTEYIADFVYKDKDGNVCVIDTKGFKTKEYELKKKMMRSLLGITIIEK